MQGIHISALYEWILSHIEELKTEQMVELASILMAKQSKANKEADYYIDGTDNMPCVHCGSIHTKKHGKASGKQRYICKDCGKTFNRFTGTVMSHSRLSISQWKELLRGIIENLTISRIAKNIEVSKSSAWINKQKICYALSKLYGKQDNFIDIAECDEYYVPVLFKGKRDPRFFLCTLGRMPRHHRSRADKIEWLQKAGIYDKLKDKPDELRDILYNREKRLRGVSREQACILTCQDRSGNLFMNATCIGRLETEDVKKDLAGRFEGDAILVTDSHNAYPGFAKAEKIQLEQIEADKHAKGPFNLGRINALHSEIARYWPKHQERTPSIKHIDLSLMAFWWLKKHNNLSTNNKVEKLYDIAQDSRLSVYTTYKDLSNRELKLNVKTYFPNKI